MPRDPPVLPLDRPANVVTGDEWRQRAVICPEAIGNRGQILWSIAVEDTQDARIDQESHAPRSGQLTRQ